MMDHQHTVLDLFCGAGGLSLGFQRAGFEIICAIDTDKAALMTYEANIDRHSIHVNLTQHIDFPSANIIISGPPCQGFSSASLRRVNDQRNTLVSRFAHIVASLQPQAFVFENVEGFLTAERGERLLELLEPLINTGYRIHVQKINAANYGVPQHRKRVIAIGGLGWNPSFPQSTHTAFGAPGAQLGARHRLRTPTIAQTLEGLPEPTTQPPGMPQGHCYRPLTPLELARALALQPGQTMRHLPNELQHASYTRRALRRVQDGTPTERWGGAPTGIRRLRPDEPSKAITGGAITEFLHPSAHRPLTLRECARLQTFPDDFTFYGSTTEQMQIIGNAVPPLLAQIIARNLAKDIETIHRRYDKGALLSFVVTLSDGISPTLRYVIDRVHQRFLQGDTVEAHQLWD